MEIIKTRLEMEMLAAEQGVPLPYVTAIKYDDAKGSTNPEPLEFMGAVARKVEPDYESHYDDPGILQFLAYSGDFASFDKLEQVCYMTTFKVAKAQFVIVLYDNNDLRDKIIKRMKSNRKIFKPLEADLRLARICSGYAAMQRPKFGIYEAWTGLLQPWFNRSVEKGIKYNDALRELLAHGLDDAELVDDMAKFVKKDEVDDFRKKLAANAGLHCSPITLHDCLSGMGETALARELGDILREKHFIK